MPLEIRPTGVPGLDTVLGGGLPRGTLLLIVGPPGTGKTILSQQLCFSWVKGTGGSPDSPSRRALYFSTLSEPHSKLIAHTEAFSFFDPDELGRGVEILSLQEFMARGLEETASAIVRQTRQFGAGLVVIDGFRALEAIAEKPLDTRDFLYKLSAQLSMLGATTVVTVERSVRESSAYGEFTTADAVLGLHNTLENVQHRRRLEVLKLRGVHHLSGLHTYRITGGGWKLFPRLEAVIHLDDGDHKEPPPSGRVSFGLDELDALTQGGLPAGTATLVAGSPGIGKTLLSLHYLSAGLGAGEPALFIGFHEDRARLLAKARQFNLDLDRYLDLGLLAIHTLPAVELELDELNSLLRAEVESRDVRRLVIDSAIGIEHPAAREGRAADYAAALHTYLRRRGITTLFTRELIRLDGPEIQAADSPLTTVCENLAVLRYVTYEGLFYRVLTVVKMRESDHERSIREFTIDRERGLRILSRDESAASVLYGITRKLRGSGSQVGGVDYPQSGSGTRRRRRGAQDEHSTGAPDG